MHHEMTSWQLCLSWPGAWYTMAELEVALEGLVLGDERLSIRLYLMTVLPPAWLCGSTPEGGVVSLTSCLVPPLAGLVSADHKLMSLK